ncbi:MAG: GGDEF domain-containing protein [Gammaproteobacteria bacterium]|nr:GGDEF domain-containing protein [Gammaproteobacteria bacterium]
MQFDLVQLATIDPLTGCLNRRSFGEKLNYELEKCRRYNTRFAIIVMDIDHFKRINDEYGHPRGDQALQCLAEKVKEVIRSTDIFSRWGGEEFIVLLPECDACKCMVVAEKIRQAVEQMSISAGNSTIQITVSIGAAVINDEGEPGEDVISRADQALYQAKNSGRNLAILADQLQSQE